MGILTARFAFSASWKQKQRGLCVPTKSDAQHVHAPATRCAMELCAMLRERLKMRVLKLHARKRCCLSFAAQLFSGRGSGAASFSFPTAAGTLPMQPVLLDLRLHVYNLCIRAPLAGCRSLHSVQHPQHLKQNEAMMFLGEDKVSEVPCVSALNIKGQCQQYRQC